MRHDSILIVVSLLTAVNFPLLAGAELACDANAPLYRSNLKIISTLAVYPLSSCLLRSSQLRRSNARTRTVSPPSTLRRP